MKRIIYLLTFLFCSCFVIGADWTMINRDPANTRWDGVNVPKISNGWSSSVNHGYFNPIIENGFIYVGSDTSLFKINASTGVVVANISAGILNNMVISNNSIYATFYYGRTNLIVKYNASDLSFITLTPTNSPVNCYNSGFIVANNYIYCGCQQISTSNLNLVSVHSGSCGIPAIYNGFAYLSSNNIFSKIDISNYTNNVNSLNISLGTPKIYNGSIYVSGASGLYKLSPFDLSIQAHYNSSTIDNFAVADGFVFIISGIRTYKLDASSLSILVNSSVNCSGSQFIAVANGFVYCTYNFGVGYFIRSMNKLLSESSLNLISYSNFTTNDIYHPLYYIAVSNSYAYVCSGTVNNGFSNSIVAYPYNNLGVSSIADISFFSPTPNISATIYNPFFDVNVSARNMSTTNLTNLTVYLYNSSGSLARVPVVVSYGGSGAPIINSFVSYSLLPVGNYFYNVTVCLVDGLCVSSPTRGVAVRSPIDFFFPTPLDGSSIYDVFGFFVNVSAHNISSVRLRNLSIYIYNSTSLLPFFPFTQTVSGNGSPVIDVFLTLSNLSLGNYFFNVSVFDVNNNSFVSLTRHVYVLSSCNESWQPMYGSCVAGQQLITYLDSNSCGTNSSLPVNNGTNVSCCVENWVSNNLGACISGLQLLTYSDTNNCGTRNNVPIDDNTFLSCPCNESWVSQLTTCINGVQFKFYSDLNNCGTTNNLPSDNGYLVDCNVCSPSWTAVFSPSSCVSGSQLKSYFDQNSCGVSSNIPFDNGSVVSCNIFSSIVTDHAPRLFDAFQVQVDAPIGANVSIIVTLPDLQTVNPSLIYNGLWFSPFIFTVSNGTYLMSAFAGNQSISASFYVSDFDTVVPTNFVSIVPAGQNFSFLIQFFTDSVLNLTHNISCSVPNGFSCVVPSSVDVFNYSNVTLIVSSNVSLPDGLYLGELNITRLIDGRLFSSVLNLGISAGFGQGLILNPSSFSAVILSNGFASKSYVVENVGNFSLDNCSVVVDGSFSNLSFVHGSNNFSISINGSVNVSVNFSSPPAGLYTGYFNVFCVASSGGLVNGLLNPQVQQLLVAPFVPPFVPPSSGGAPSIPLIVYGGNASIFLLLNSGGVPSGYISYSYPSESFSKTFIVESKVSNSLSLVPSCRGDFCQYVKFSKDSLSISGFGTDFFVATVSVPKSVALDGVYSYEVVLSDGSNSVSLLNEVHISSLSAWYSKFALVVQKGDKGFWFSVGNFGVPKILLYLLLVLLFDGLTLLVLPKDKFYRKNIVLVLTFVSLVVFGLSALIF